MAYNKFIKKDGTIMLDLTDTTVSSETLSKDITAVDKYGNKIVGTLSNGLPIEVDSLDNSLLISENNGKVYKCDDKLYQVHKVTSLKGLTIKFNEHVTPCPVIGENDVFECSGLAMASWSPFYYGNPKIATISKSHEDLFSPSDVCFEIHDYVIVDGEVDSGSMYFLHYTTSNSMWCVMDENGNELSVYNPSITNFDCPALNENVEFIEWVMANARVYSKIESLSDIENLKFEQPYIGSLDLSGAIAEVYGEFGGRPRISGRYTASFSVNGELITKTFSTFFTNYYPENGESGEVVAYFSEGNDFLSFCYSGTDESTDLFIYQLEYNGDILDDGVTFTTFDCALNESYYMLSFVLCDVNANIGYAALRELITPTGTLEVTVNGKVDVKDYEKVDVNVVETNEEKEIEMLGGNY